MRLTADLDIRYLWVDSLCLRQDEPLLNRYLNQMHNIYHNAYLTVVVANKDNADSGITGYKTCPTGRKLPGLVVNYPNHVLGFTERDECDGLSWFSRGWTLQEGFFARRALVISDRILLSCAQGFAEEGAGYDYFNHNHSPQKGMESILPSICQSSDRLLRLD
jgi:hypothetical protein